MLKHVKARYRQSQAMLERAEKVIPLGSQTFSKSRIQFPEGAAPLFLDRGQGGRVWDVDGNEYVDLINGLCCVSLGYCDPDVDDAIREQLGRGITFSLATRLESVLAERLVELIPCAEAVRFGKNGSDATLGCVRVARAATGREKIVAVGYHGWHDWYVGSTVRNKGVPKAASENTIRVPYNDLAALEQAFLDHADGIAGVILEPMNAIEPQPGYLADLAAMTRKHGALVIFDEIVTGFRYALGGAQALFGVTPDLAAFGKGLGNGMPISVLAGRADLMREVEEVFLSATFGGECLAIAAAIAVIDKMRREPVIEHLWRTGEDLTTRVRACIDEFQLGEAISLNGKPPWMLLGFNDQAKARGPAIKTLFLKEMLAHGVLLNASHNISYAHTMEDIDTVVRAYKAALSRVAQDLDDGNLEANLECPVIMPVFSVR